MRSDRRRGGLLPGIALVVVGAAVLLSRSRIFAGPGVVVLAVGVLFLLVSAARGFSGPLLAGGILTGLGAGLTLRPALAPWFPEWGAILLGLGVGFLFVAAVDAARGRSRRPSPVVPGFVLTLLALFSAVRRIPAFRWLSDVDLEGLWPWAALVAGLFLIGRASLQRRSD